MKIKIIIIYFLFLSCALFGQTISVSSFKLLDTDLTANTAGTMEIDQNGETAALIKVVTTQIGFTFDGGALGIVKTKQTPGEVWVYIPKGSKKISIKHPQLGVLRDYYYPIAIEAARTYEMVLISGEVQTTIKQARTSQYVVFQLTPPNSVVEFDGELLQTTDGTATKMMKFGTYNYRVQAPNYFPEAGNITVNDPINKHIFNISLKPNFSIVNISVDNEAEIWVNGELKGVGTWTGNLGAGTYELESRKQNHRTISITRDIIVTKEPQNIKLQSPTPIFGDADINSAPAMAEIYIDDKKVGQTPQTLPDILIGNHQIRISKQGYKDYSASLVIKEGETNMLSVSLEKLEAENESMTPSANDNIRTFTVGNVSFKMIRVDGGTFTMGFTGEKGNLAVEDEIPAHQVTLSSYYIGETEVTQGLWEAVMGKNPSYYKGANRPVEKVSWKDCQMFIQKLNKKTGLEFRLPTEAEWEYAARGGSKSLNFEYSGGHNLYDVASLRRTYDVKSKRANELGLYDMSGNVSEWVQDYYGGYSISDQTNPTGPLSSSGRVNRGGGYDDIWKCRVCARLSASPNLKVSYIGLRLAL